eukprot:1184811-Prorocentrum_minimum.AAC.3
MQHSQVPANMQSQDGGAANRMWKTWQSDEDIPQRRELVHQMYVRVKQTLNSLCASSLLLFQQKTPSVTKEWQQKLPDFVQKLEEKLYRSAANKLLRFGVFFFEYGAASEIAFCFTHIGRFLKKKRNKKRTTTEIKKHVEAASVFYFEDFNIKAHTSILTMHTCFFSPLFWSFPVS